MKKFRRNEQGATAIEYGLIIALIVIAMLAGLTILADGTGNIFANVASKAEDNM